MEPVPGANNANIPAIYPSGANNAPFPCAKYEEPICDVACLFVIGVVLAGCNTLWILAVCCLQFESFFTRCWCNGCVLSLGVKAYNVLIPTARLKDETGIGWEYLWRRSVFVVIVLKCNVQPSMWNHLNFCNLIYFSTRRSGSELRSNNYERDEINLHTRVHAYRRTTS
jgi:hypothetical protein